MVAGIIKGGSFLIDTIQPDHIFTPEDINVNQKLMAKMLETFLRGVDVPKEFGGFGVDKIISVIVTKQTSIGGPFAIASVVHTAFGTLLIFYFANREQKTQYLPDLAKGKKIGGFALTEPDAGTDALSSRTTATLSEDGKYYILNGTKQFISNSINAVNFSPSIFA